MGRRLRRGPSLWRCITQPPGAVKTAGLRRWVPEPRPTGHGPDDAQARHAMPGWWAAGAPLLLMAARWRRRAACPRTKGAGELPTRPLARRERHAALVLRPRTVRKNVARWPTGDDRCRGPVVRKQLSCRLPHPAARSGAPEGRGEARLCRCPCSPGNDGRSPRWPALRMTGGEQAIAGAPPAAGGAHPASLRVRRADLGAGAAGPAGGRRRRGHAGGGDRPALWRRAASHRGDGGQVIPLESAGTTEPPERRGHRSAAELDRLDLCALVAALILNDERGWPALANEGCRLLRPWGWL
jgi:hypothetical protein